MKNEAKSQPVVLPTAERPTAVQDFQGLNLRSITILNFQVQEEEDGKDDKGGGKGGGKGGKKGGGKKGGGGKGGGSKSKPKTGSK